MQWLRRIRIKYLHVSALLGAWRGGLYRNGASRWCWANCVQPQEGRALGEVTKVLVYNARKRQQGGDRAENYVERTECVAGVEGTRFQELVPDVLNLLGVTHIDRFVSMSNMKFDALVRQGIRVGEGVEIPPGLVLDDANVEIDAKRAAGYLTENDVSGNDLKVAKGRGLHE